LVVRDETATSRGTAAAHDETRVACRATDRIEAPDKPGALPGPCLSPVSGRKEVRRAIKDETHVDGRAADIEQGLFGCLMLLDRPVVTVPGCQNVAPRFATADRDARGDARADDRVEEVWRHGLEGPASTACTQDGTMAELVSHGI